MSGKQCTAWSDATFCIILIWSTLFAQACLPKHLAFTTLWANSADDKLIFFLFFLENRIRHFMHIVSDGDSLHEMSNPAFWIK